MKPKLRPGKDRIYNTAFLQRGREGIVKWDILDIKDGEKLKLVFESAASNWRQGVWLRTDQWLRVNEIQNQSFEIWFDTAPTNVVFECRTSDGLLSVYNIWDSGRGYGTESQTWSSGMLVDELANGRRYRCNDIGFETDFDKLVFRIERVSDNDCK